MTYQKYVWPHPFTTVCTFLYFQHFLKNQFLKIRPLKKFMVFMLFFLLFSRIEFSSHDEMILIDVFLSLLTNKRSKITSVSPKNELQPKYFLSINSFLLVYNIREGKSRTLNRLTTRRSEQHSVGWQCHGVTI